MSLKAIALHISIWENRFEELSTAESHLNFPSSTLAHCKICNTPYVVLLLSYMDVRTDEYLAELESRISQDCREGAHILTEFHLEMEPRQARFRSLAAHA
jgi:hypothetical protein